jgi:hypothetical protein
MKKRNLLDFLKKKKINAGDTIKKISDLFSLIQSKQSKNKILNIPKTCVI